MSEQKKYITFKDLRTIAPKSESSPSISSSTSTSSTTSISPEVKPPPAETPPSVAPERDFQRIPNSVTRRALPEGLFRGKSKQVWDYLWSVSRGAVVPVRTVHKSRREIKAGSGLGSMVTVDAALKHLEAIGLISMKGVVGSHGGNEYEVFTPEEAAARYTSSTSTSRYTSPTQNLVYLDVLDSSISSTGQIVENKDTSPVPNTLFKTKERNTDDDEAFARFRDAVAKASRELTGREPSAAEADKWGELAEVLVTELKIAAGRTTVSSVPAFLAEHLRRRLWKRDKREIEAEAGPGRKNASEGRQGPKTGHPAACPDCFGTGMFYPDGFDKGVARCPHKNLPTKPDRQSV